MPFRFNPFTDKLDLTETGGSGPQSVLEFITNIAGPVMPTVGGSVTLTGTNIFTNGTVANTVAFNLQGTLNSLFLGQGANTPSVNISPGTNGQLLIGATGAAPAWASLTSSDSSITYTAGINSLNLAVTNASGIVRTINLDSGSITGQNTIFLISKLAGTDYTGSSVNISFTAPNIALISFSDSNFNTLIGHTSGNSTLSGGSNSALGQNTLHALTGGQFNTAIGRSTLQSLTSGQVNTCIGNVSGAALLTGSSNTLIGSSTGSAYTSSETGNILIGNDVRGVVGESQVTRIGNAGNGGSMPQTACYIDGITGVTVAASAPVAVASTGRLSSLGFGTSGQVLVSGGAGVSPSWASATPSFTLTGNTGTATSSAGNINIVGANTTAKFTGSGATLTWDFGISNIILGSAGGSITSGAQNIGMGSFCLGSITSGGNNTCIGVGTGNTILTGGNNCLFGFNSGSAYTGAESSNICIFNNGVVGESAVTRIGSTQTKAFMAGIFGVTVGASGLSVVIDNAGQLGTVVSSIKFKKNVREINELSNRLSQLRPVIFQYISNNVESYGLIAEEVEHIMPELVAKDSNNEIVSVKYQEIPILLLNEFKKLLYRIEKLEKKLN